MATANTSTPLRLEEPVPRPWTREEYHRLQMQGFFDGQRVELVDGEIVLMSAQGPRHVRAAHRVVKALERVVGSGFWVRMQAPLAIDDADEPAPDAAIVPGTDDDYDEHPTSALLVVEVSEATRRFDLETKALKYAGAGIPEYWVVDLIAGELVVFLQPTTQGYLDRQVKSYNDVVSLSQIAGASITVAELLPRLQRPSRE
jgi:Uma2 family endonuclease